MACATSSRLQLTSEGRWGTRGMEVLESSGGFEGWVVSEWAKLKVEIGVPRRGDPELNLYKVFRRVHK